MKFEAPNSYTSDPGILTLEVGDPALEEIEKVFLGHGLELTPKKDSRNELEVSVAKPRSILEMIYILILSKATYIYVKGMSAVNELKDR